jgi:hypothetical protein
MNAVTVAETTDSSTMTAGSLIAIRIFFRKSIRTVLLEITKSKQRRVFEIDLIE